MKLIKCVFLLLLANIGLTQNCPPLDIELLSEELTIRQSQLQDSMDECPNLTDAINLSQVFIKLDEPHVAEEVMLDALNEVVFTDIDRIHWLQNSIDIALSAKNTCQASQYLNELSHLPVNDNDYNTYRKKLFTSTKNQVLNSQTIGCALAESRSVSFRGMKIKPKIDLAIHFEFNSDQLTEKGIKQTQQLASALKTNKLKSSALLLIGHTDSVGTDAYNMDLSHRRSLSVKNHLLTIDKGFNNRITTKGMGETQLLSQGTTDEDHQLNRRVEIQIQ